MLWQIIIVANLLFTQTTNQPSTIECRDRERLGHSADRNQSPECGHAFCMNITKAHAEWKGLSRFGANEWTCSGLACFNVSGQWQACSGLIYLSKWFYFLFWSDIEIKKTRSISPCANCKPCKLEQTNKQHNYCNHHHQPCLGSHENRHQHSHHRSGGRTSAGARLATVLLPRSAMACIFSDFQCRHALSHQSSFRTFCWNVCWELLVKCSGN